MELLVLSIGGGLPLSASAPAAGGSPAAGPMPRHSPRLSALQSTWAQPALLVWYRAKAGMGSCICEAAVKERHTQVDMASCKQGWEPCWSSRGPLSAGGLGSPAGLGLLLHRVPAVGALPRRPGLPHLGAAIAPRPARVAVPPCRRPACSRRCPCRTVRVCVHLRSPRNNTYPQPSSSMPEAWQVAIPGRGAGRCGHVRLGVGSAAPQWRWASAPRARPLSLSCTASPCRLEGAVGAGPPAGSVSRGSRLSK